MVTIRLAAEGDVEALCSFDLVAGTLVVSAK
jgi:hypothetical protein